MKKVLVLLALVVMGLTVVGCNASTEQAGGPPKTGSDAGAAPGEGKTDGNVQAAGAK